MVVKINRQIKMWPQYLLLLWLSLLGLSSCQSGLFFDTKEDQESVIHVPLQLPIAEEEASSHHAAVADDDAQADSKVGYVLETCTVDHRNNNEHSDKTVLYRGEMVTLQEDVAHNNRFNVRLSDNSQGLLNADCLLTEHNAQTAITLATVVVPTKTFLRPDLLAMNPRLVIEPGTLLLTQHKIEQFTAVNLRRGLRAWVLTATLEQTHEEVEAAKLWSRSHQLPPSRAVEAEQIVQLLKQTWGHTRLVHTVFPPPPPDPVLTAEPNQFNQPHLGLPLTPNSNIPAALPH